MVFLKNNQIFMIVSTYFLCSNLIIAQDNIPVVGDEVVSLIPVSSILQERENLHTECRKCCIRTGLLLSGSIMIPVLLVGILEYSLPLRTYTICNASNNTLNIAYNTKSLYTRPTITILDDNNCYGLQAHGSLSFLCAYDPDNIDFDYFGSSTDDMKCATNKGLEHNFQWYIDEKKYLNRGLSQDDSQNNFLDSSYTELSKIEDKNSNTIGIYHLKGSIK